VRTWALAMVVFVVFSTVPDARASANKECTGADIAEFPLPHRDSASHVIVAGPDGNLWFCEKPGNRIGRMTVNGYLIAEYPLPNPNSQPRGIIAGPDGNLCNLWFTEIADRIGVMTLDGVLVAEFDLQRNSYPRGIATGPAGRQCKMA